MRDGTIGEFDGDELVAGLARRPEALFDAVKPLPRHAPIAAPRGEADAGMRRPGRIADEEQFAGATGVGDAEEGAHIHGVGHGLEQEGEFGSGALCHGLIAQPPDARLAQGTHGHDGSSPREGEHAHAEATGGTMPGDDDGAWLRERPLVSRRWPPRRKKTIPSWPRSRLGRWSRRVVVSGLALPALRLAYALQTRGRDRLRTIEEPCIIISNHNMHADIAMIIRALPHGLRQRVAVAAAKDDIYGNPVRGFFASLLANAFPFANEGTGIRESLSNLITMLDEGWNVIIFPEGEMTVMGPMQPFKPGTGRLAQLANVPVLPVRVDVLRPGFWEGRWLPTPRARVRVTFGRQLRVPRELSGEEARLLLERAVREA